MIRKSALLLLLIQLTLVSLFGSNIRDYFSNMPDSIMPLLTKTDRLDMIDFLDNDMKAVVINRFKGSSELLELSDYYLNLNYTEKSNYQIRLFFKADSVPIISVVHTVKSGDYQDSKLKFYDDNWNVLDNGRLIKEPLFDDYFVKSTLKSDSLKAIKERITLRFQHIETFVEKAELRFRLLVIEHHENEVGVVEHLAECNPMVFVWKGEKFKRKKR